MLFCITRVLYQIASSAARGSQPEAKIPNLGRDVHPCSALRAACGWGISVASAVGGRLSNQRGQPPKKPCKTALLAFWRDAGRRTALWRQGPRFMRRSSHQRVFGDEEPDAGRNRFLQREGDAVEDRFTHRCERKRKEYQPFHEHRQQRELPAVAHCQHHGEREKGVQPHSRSQHNKDSWK